MAGQASQVLISSIPVQWKDPGNKKMKRNKTLQAYDGASFVEEWVVWLLDGGREWLVHAQVVQLPMHKTRSV